MSGPSDDALCCPAHPDSPAVAACVDCGRWLCVACRVVGDDGLSHCSSCRGHAADAAERRPAADSVPPPPPMPVPTPQPVVAPPARAEARVQVVGPTPVPWEQARQRSDLMAFAMTAREALMGPSRFMGRIPWASTDLRAPLIFAVLAGVVGQLGLLILAPFFGPAAAATGAVGGMAQNPAANALSMAPLLPLMVTVSVFACAGLAHWMLRLAGNPPRPFGATFRIYAYAEVSSLLLWVPWVGPYAARFYYVLLLLTGLRLAQNAGFSASLLAMAPSLVLMWVLV